MAENNSHHKQPNSQILIGDDNGFSQTRFSKKNTIVVVEDNSINQEVIKAFFDRLNLVIHITSNGLQGVQKILQLHKDGYSPNLVLMDLHMPIMGGIEATRKIRSTPELQGIPVIALSADPFNKTQKEAFFVGVNDYLTKPLDIKKLLAVLKKYLSYEILDNDASKRKF